MVLRQTMNIFSLYQSISRAPNKNWVDVVFAAIAIQRAFRKYKARKFESRTKVCIFGQICFYLKSIDLRTFFFFGKQNIQRAPNKNWVDVVFAAIAIQRAFRKYKSRKQSIEKAPKVPKRTWADLVFAAIAIQRAFRKYKCRSKVCILGRSVQNLGFIISSA